MTTSQQRVFVRKLRRHILFYCQKRKAFTTLSQLREVLINELNLKKGDRVIVASSFGNLHADYTPEDVIKLLQSIITPEGVIMMPYYPPMNSDEWAKKGYVFDMKETKSGMGILTNVFSEMPDVYKSKHPTKAVCVWGKNAEEIVLGHENSKTPFYWDSPYGKMLKIGSKSLGLGIKNIPIFHAFEDIFSENTIEYYEPIKYKLKVRLTNGTEEIVETYVHNSDLLATCVSAGDYVASLHCESFKKVDFGYGFVYIVDNISLFEKVKNEFLKGHTRIKK